MSALQRQHGEPGRASYLCPRDGAEWSAPAEMFVMTGVELIAAEREPRDCNTEYHDGDEPAVCVGQWCCGCAEHPIGKPWGWNYRAWAEHNTAHHPSRGAA